MDNYVPPFTITSVMLEYVSKIMEKIGRYRYRTEEVRALFPGQAGHERRSAYGEDFSRKAALRAGRGTGPRHDRAGYLQKGRSAAQ